MASPPVFPPQLIADAKLAMSRGLFMLRGPPGVGKNTLLTQLGLPLKSFDLEAELTVDNVQKYLNKHFGWCSFPTTSTPAGPTLSVLQPVEMITPAAMPLVVKYGADHPKLRLVLVGAYKYPHTCPIVYMNALPMQTRETLAAAWGCPPSKVR